MNGKKAKKLRRENPDNPRPGRAQGGGVVGHDPDRVHTHKGARQQEQARSNLFSKHIGRKMQTEREKQEARRGARADIEEIEGSQAFIDRINNDPQFAQRVTDAVERFHEQPLADDPSITVLPEDELTPEQLERLRKDRKNAQVRAARARAKAAQ